MKEWFLEYCTCPLCEEHPSRLSLSLPEYRRGEIFQGSLVCSKGHSFRIENFIPDFVEPFNAAGLRSHFYDSLWHEHAAQSYKGRKRDYAVKFQGFAKLPEPLESYFADKIILDAGCGVGRFTFLASSCGAKRVIGIDYSKLALRTALEGTGNPANCTFVRADILNIPLSCGFDYVFSLGVLHHTPGTRKAFLAIARLLKPGSYITVYVYGKHTLPLMTWPLRLFTLRVDKSVVLRACNWFGFSYDPAVKGRVPIKKTFLALKRFDLLGISRLTYEGLSTPYLWEHSFKEVKSWFKEAGITIVSNDPRLVSVTGKLPTKLLP